MHVLCNGFERIFYTFFSGYKHYTIQCAPEYFQHFKVITLYHTHRVERVRYAFSINGLYHISFNKHIQEHHVMHTCTLMHYITIHIRVHDWDFIWRMQSFCYWNDDSVWSYTVTDVMFAVFSFRIYMRIRWRRDVWIRYVVYNFTSYITFLYRKIHIFTFVDRRYLSVVLNPAFVIDKRDIDWCKHECLFDVVFLRLIGSCFTSFNVISDIISRYFVLIMLSFTPVLKVLQLAWKIRV